MPTKKTAAGTAPIKATAPAAENEQPAAKPGKPAKPPAHEPKRNEKARARTRAKLIAAAREVMGRKGIEATAINDITEQAELSFGSFYNYFPSKEEIARAVFVEDAIRLTDILDAEALPDSDIAERIAYNIRRTLRYSLNDPIWGWFLIHSAYSMNDVVATLGSRLARDVKTGADSGRLKMADIGATTDCILGGTLHLLRQILQGDRPASAIEHVVDYVLRGLGISEEEARRLAHLPLPESSMSVRGD